MTDAIESWTRLKDRIGEDLALFTIFMASAQAHDVAEGFVRMAKGGSYIKPQTLEQMEKEIIRGLAADTLEQKLGELLFENEQIRQDVMEEGIQDLDDWMEAVSSPELYSYFSYLSRWDLDGHDWKSERPQPFASFITPGTKEKDFFYHQA